MFAIYKNKTWLEKNNISMHWSTGFIFLCHMGKEKKIEIGT